MREENTSADGLTDNAPKKRGQIIVVVGLLLAAVIYFGISMRKTEQNFYAPGRAALVNAKIKLEQTLTLEQTYIKERRQAHRDIEIAIADLTSVAEVDPQDRAEIAELLRQLKEIEKVDIGNTPDADAISNRYRSVMQKMDELIQKQEQLRP